MFSGITQGLFPITSIQKDTDILHYTVDLSPTVRQHLEIGSSVSVNGVCQTVVALCDAAVSFDAIEETLNKTTLHALQLGELVSIERSLRWGDEVGGHLVSGHVYGTGIIAKRIEHGESISLCLQCDPAWMKYITPKGYIALDGSSLTVGDTSPDQGLFTVHLIPETLHVTNFVRKQAGQRVNIEFDSQTKLIVDSVEYFLRQKSSTK
jgi:riboflavin synthase